MQDEFKDNVTDPQNFSYYLQPGPLVEPISAQMFFRWHPNTRWQRYSPDNKRWDTYTYSHSGPLSPVPLDLVPESLLNETY